MKPAVAAGETGGRDGRDGNATKQLTLRSDDAATLAAMRSLGTMMPYERFDAWRLCHELGLEIYRVTARFPREELYGLSAQARRAAFSAAANIAEGSAKRGRRESRRFLDISLGSLVELAYVVRFASDLGYLTPDDAAHITALRERAAIVTWKLYRSMNPRTDTPS